MLNTNAPEQVIPAIFRETRAYYVLGFQRANAVDDGKVHEIKVRVNRPGAIVRARSAYYAPLPETRARPARRFDAQSTILDGRGHVVKSEHYNVTFDTPPDDAVTVLTHLALKSGQYDVRVAAKSGDRTASVYGYVDVPSMHADRMWVSELFVEDGSTPVMSSLETSQVLSATPTARRTFDPSDPIVPRDVQANGLLSSGAQQSAKSGSAPAQVEPDLRVVRSRRTICVRLEVPIFGDAQTV